MTDHRACVALYLLALSMLAFCLMGFDKGRARRGGRRVRERTLWLAALVGGGPGAFVAMHLFRHKTRHWQFQVGLPLLALLDAGFLVWVQTGCRVLSTNFT